MVARCVRIAIVCLLMVAGGGVASATPFFDFFGFDYLDGPPYSVGTTVTVPMAFDRTQPDLPIPMDLEQYEATVLVSALQITDVQASGGVVSLTFAGGLIQIFEDPAKNAQWSDNPPNAQVPASFTDGTLILGGTFTDCVMIFDLTMGTGTVQGHVDFTTGSRLNEIDVPAGWLFYGGVSTNPIFGIPAGYEMAWDPQLMSPEATATRQTTWGKVRGLFR
jgi:hypothetical protein